MNYQNIRWLCLSFTDLSARRLYDILALRSRIFVVEQASIYDETDGVDLDCWHLLGLDENNQLIAYSRLIEPNIKYSETSAIGRVVIEPKFRNSGLGKLLLEQSVLQCLSLWPKYNIALSAQCDKQKLYEKFGFVAYADAYDDGGIMHIDMLRVTE